MHAFTTSPYPVILSLEVHCSLPQQQRMAQIMKAVFGDMVRGRNRCAERLWQGALTLLRSRLVTYARRQLYTEPPKPNSTELPSPQALKGKILIKGKRLADDAPSTVSSVNGAAMMKEREEEDDEDDEDEIEVRLGTAQRSHRGLCALTQTIRAWWCGAWAHAGPQRQKKKKSKAVKTHPELSDLVQYCRAVHFKVRERCRLPSASDFLRSSAMAAEHGGSLTTQSFDRPGKPEEMSSFGEKKSEKYATNKTEQYSTCWTPARAHTDRCDANTMWHGRRVHALDVLAPQSNTTCGSFRACTLPDHVWTRPTSTRACTGTRAAKSSPSISRCVRPLLSESSSDVVLC